MKVKRVYPVDPSKEFSNEPLVSAIGIDTAKSVRPRKDCPQFGGVFTGEKTVSFRDPDLLCLGAFSAER